MKYYIIGIIAILISLFIYLNNRDIEHFQIETSNHSVTNSNNKIDNDLFTIEKHSNPLGKESVLHQIGFNSKSYDINVDMKPNTNYNLVYYLGKTADYLGADYTIELVGNKSQIVFKQNLTDTVKKDNIEWNKLENTFNSNDNTKMLIKIGGVGNYTSGSRMYSDFMLNSYLDNLTDFYFLDKLLFFVLINKKTEKNVKRVKSQINKYNIEFTKDIEINNNLLSLKNNEGRLPFASTIISNKDYTNEFSIIFSYKGEDFDTGTLLKIGTVNDISKGIEVVLNNSTGIENTLDLIIGGKKYIYRIGIANRMVNYFITYNNGTVKVYIDGVLIKSDDIESLIPKTPLGTCPDGWTYDGEGRCINRGDHNVGTCGNSATFNDMDDESKLNWSNGCGVPWLNCNKLEKNMTASKKNTSCKQNDKLYFANTPIILNEDENLKGHLKSMLFYLKSLEENEISNIHKYLLVKNASLSLDSVCNRPVMVRESVEGPDVQSVDDNTECPFNDKSLCQNIDCTCVNWTTLSNLSNKCKTKVNKYCRNNYNDPMCNKLRSRKCKILNKPVPKQSLETVKTSCGLKQVIVNHENSDINISEVNKANHTSEVHRANHISEVHRESQVSEVNDNNNLQNIANNTPPKTTEQKVKDIQEKDCTGCHSKIDLTKYIEKDKIPCWGCNLE